MFSSRGRGNTLRRLLNSHMATRGQQTEADNDGSTPAIAAATATPVNAPVSACSDTVPILPSKTRPAIPTPFNFRRGAPLSPFPKEP